MALSHEVILAMRGEGWMRGRGALQEDSASRTKLVFAARSDQLGELDCTLTAYGLPSD